MNTFNLRRSDSKVRNELSSALDISLEYLPLNVRKDVIDLICDSLVVISVSTNNNIEINVSLPDKITFNMNRNYSREDMIQYLKNLGYIK